MNKRKLYSDLCKKMDLALFMHNVCDIQVLSKGIYRTVSCVRNHNINCLCCDGNHFSSAKSGENKCRHHSKKGCKVQSLGCKIFLCDKALLNLKHDFTDRGYLAFMQKREHVIQQIMLHNIPCKPRTSKKDNFKSHQ